MASLLGSSIQDRAKFESAYIGFHTIFNMVLATADLVWADLVTVVQSRNPIEEYKWIGEIPKFKEWLGRRAVQKLRAEGVQVTNKKYSNGIELEENDLEDDNLGLVAARVEDLALAFFLLIEDLVVGILVAGFTTAVTTYDGQQLFDTDHTADGNGEGTSQSNTHALELNQANFDTVYNQMLTVFDENEDPLNVRPTILLVGPTNRAAMRDILEKERLANGESNVNRGIVRGIVTARITDSKWFLIDNSKSARAIIVQIRKEARLLAITEASEQFFWEGKMAMGADGELAAAAIMWQTVAGSNPP